MYWYSLWVLTGRSICALQKRLVEGTLYDIIAKTYLMYSGDCWYFSNSHTHSSCVNGGSVPVNFQSVIDKPERVRRVMPPITTKLKTHAAQPKSHIPTAFCAWGPFVTSSLRPELVASDVVEFSIAAVVDILLVDWFTKFWNKHYNNINHGTKFNCSGQEYALQIRYLLGINNL